MLLLAASLFIGSFALGVAYILLFWVVSFCIFLVAWCCAACGFYVDISGNRNLFVLFLTVLSLSVWIYSLEGSNIGYALFVLVTGFFFLCKSADIWRFGAC